MDKSITLYVPRCRSGLYSWVASVAVRCNL